MTPVDYTFAVGAGGSGGGTAGPAYILGNGSIDRSQEILDLLRNISARLNTHSSQQITCPRCGSLCQRCAQALAYPSGNTPTASGWG